MWEISTRQASIESISLDLERKVRERTSDLELAKEAAEAASRAKSEFLANMSHEIRTPMNGVLGMTELALDTDLNAEQREYLRIVKNSADALLTVINDILDFSKIEAGMLDLDSSEFSVRETVEETIKTLALSAHQKGLELVCDIDAAVPDKVAGDAMRIRQILVNLVGNAVKFTETGEVVVTVTARPEEDSPGRIELSFAIRDTGIGIPLEKQNSIFQAFSQADTSSTRRHGGTGLGLTISKRLVELMGGHIGVESERRRGSTFWFTVPVGMVAARVEEMPSLPEDLRGVPVLVVDDNETNRRLLGDWLTRWGMWPMLVDSGDAAIKILKSLVDPLPLVLTDVHMPEMDGFDLLEHIKQHMSAATIIMLTSGSYPGDVARSRELGAEAYLLKPVRPSDLLQTIRRVLKDRGPMPRIGGGGSWTGAGIRQLDRRLHAESGGGLRILVAEDNLNNQHVARSLLTRLGHEVAIVGDGRQAVQALEREAFDLVLMDIQMPEMDGYEAVRSIRAREKFSGAHVPVVAMTAHAMAGDREKCLEAGMDGYVAKPIRKSELADVIKEVTLRSAAAKPVPIDTAERHGHGASDRRPA
jgi:CheY-like chemotaxis protein/nitrogen-specific signal transduction histidine kinase